MSDRPAWEALCFGQWQPLEEQEQAQAEQQQRAPQGSSSKADSGGTDRILGPVLRTVLALDQVRGCDLAWVYACLHVSAHVRVGV